MSKPLLRTSSAVYERLLRGEATPREYTDAIRRDVHERMPGLIERLRRRYERRRAA